MTLLQVNPSLAAAQFQTTRVKVILSQAQLAALAQQDHALYAKIMKAYAAGSPLVVTQHEYRVIGRLSAAYLGSAKAGQPAPGAPGSKENPITPGPKASAGPTFAVPTSGPLVPWIQGMAQLAADLSAGAALFPPLAAASMVILGIELVLIIVNVILALPWKAATAAK